MHLLTILSALTAIAAVAASPVTPNARRDVVSCDERCAEENIACIAEARGEDDEIDWYIIKLTVIVRIQDANNRAVAKRPSVFARSTYATRYSAFISEEGRGGNFRHQREERRESELGEESFWEICSQRSVSIIIPKSLARLPNQQRGASFLKPMAVRWMVELSHKLLPARIPPRSAQKPVTRPKLPST